jgi:hypothetical protein
MPIPTPNAGESQDHFISRCMGDSNMQEYPPPQRRAICQRQWDGRKDAESSSARAALRFLEPR